VSLTNNVATLTAANTFAAGDSVTVTGLTSAFLDGTYTITAATATTFSYALTHLAVPATTDSGSADVTDYTFQIDSGTVEFSLGDPSANNHLDVTGAFGTPAVGTTAAVPGL